MILLPKYLKKLRKYLGNILVIFFGPKVHIFENILQKTFTKYFDFHISYGILACGMDNHGIVHVL